MNFLKRWFFLSFLTIKYSFLIVSRALGLNSNPYEKLIRLYLEEAGGAFVKLGQILALRYEVLKPSFCLELAELFDNVAPMPYDYVVQLIRWELKCSLDDVFTLIEEQPVAAASFAQVHRAILKDGRVVAVKVQRPGLEEKVKHDFKFLKFAAFFAVPLLNIKALRLKEILGDLEITTYKELDYRIEKNNAEIIRNNIKNEKFLVPRTYTELTTRRLLIQDFVSGIKLNDIVRARAGKISSENFGSYNFNLDDVAMELIAELARQYYEDGIYHGDPHPGNVILTQEGKIAFVDFGIVGEVKKYSRCLFWNFIKYVIRVNDNPRKVSQTFLRLGLRPIEDRIRFLAQGKEEPVDTFFSVLDEIAGAYEKTMNDILLGWGTAIGDPKHSLYERSTAISFIKAMRLAEEYGVHFQRDLIPFIRTLIIADMMAMQISPTFKITESLKKFAQENKDVVEDMEKYLETNHEVDDERLSDPWNEGIRENAKEYLIDWLDDLIENRQSLYKRIKPQVEKLKKQI